MITGPDTIFRVSMIHCALRSLRLIRSWEGLSVYTFSHPVLGKTMKPSKMEPRTECCQVPPREITLVSLLFGTTRLLSIVMRTLCAVGGGWRAQPWPEERHKAADEVPVRLTMENWVASAWRRSDTEESHKSHNSLHWEIVDLFWIWCLGS